MKDGYSPMVSIHYEMEYYPQQNTTPPVNTTMDELWNLLTIVMIIITTGIGSIVTVIGNSVVLIAFLTDKKLHKTSNYYIISLATADLLVGVVSIPLFGVYVVMNYWPLGEILCKMWLMLDYSLCFTSLLMILIICIDRYWSVSNVVNYKRHFNHKIAMIMILPTWTFPPALFFILVWLWEYIADAPPMAENTCIVPYDNEPLANVIIATGSFWIPLGVILVLYGNVYKVARRIEKRRNALAALTQISSNNMLLINRGGTTDTKQDGDDFGFETDVSTALSRNISKVSERSGKSEANRRMKAMKMLSVILGCYIICWAPFSILVIVRSYWPKAVPDLAWNIAYCMCYVNSTVNPFCYAYANSRFKSVGLQILCSRSRRK